MKHPTSRSMGINDPVIRGVIASRLMQSRIMLRGETLADRRLATIRRAGLSTLDTIARVESRIRSSRKARKRSLNYWHAVRSYFDRAA